MQLSKYNYALISLLSCSVSYAAIPIESMSLSQNSTASIAPTTATNNTSTSDNSTVPVNINWQLMQKSEKLEEEVRRLRGTIEEHENTIQQLKKDLDNHYADLDQRLQILQQKVDDQQQQQAQQPSAAPVAPSVPATPKTVVPPTTTNKPASTNKATSIAPETTAETKKTDLTEKEAYTLALEAYKQGGAKKAIAPMQDFIKNYPKSIYIGNAHFWLAEFNLAITPANYVAAKKNYDIVAKQYAESDKASRALYQLYSIAKEVDHNLALATKYKQIILSKYQDSKEAGYFKTTSKS
ncbi:YbgF trimerization domain-containing protein [Acinetobacter boissieri]|uniref:TolA-binding protein n=1 Tax=Acinetobacter boissieri TaxID=1219383 RepID=A0A1G6H235_9GAMM|nr:YbgF trimerization domain-containing protein [Acinetobacter boissieri]SDB88224.1 TolA-binding protein [Acinetobacter boissieri]